MCRSPIISGQQAGVEESMDVRGIRAREHWFLSWSREISHEMLVPSPLTFLQQLRFTTFFTTTSVLKNGRERDSLLPCIRSLLLSALPIAS